MIKNCFIVLLLLVVALFIAGQSFAQLNPGEKVRSIKGVTCNMERMELYDSEIGSYGSFRVLVDRRVVIIAEIYNSHTGKTYTRKFENETAISMLLKHGYLFKVDQLLVLGGAYDEIPDWEKMDKNNKKIVPGRQPEGLGLLGIDP